MAQADPGSDALGRVMISVAISDLRRNPSAVIGGSDLYLIFAEIRGYPAYALCWQCSGNACIFLLRSCSPMLSNDPVPTVVNGLCSRSEAALGNEQGQTYGRASYSYMTNVPDFMHELEFPIHPFHPNHWPSATRTAAQALWDWHTGLQQLSGKHSAQFREETQRLEANQTPTLIQPPIWQAARDACASRKLYHNLLLQQMEAAAHFQGPIRFETPAERNDWLTKWTGAHGRLLAKLAGVGGSWQIGWVEALFQAVFLTERLVDLPQDLARDHLWIPESDLAPYDVSLEDLKQGALHEGVRRAIWKQVVRGRDAYARAQPLVQELPRRFRRPFKQAWTGGLMLLDLIERRDSDVWSEPIALSKLQRTQVRLQAFFGKASFQKR